MSEIITNQVNQFEAVFARELTPDLAGLYVRGLVAEFGGLDQKDDEAFITRGKEWHFQMGAELYGPLIVGYTKWLENSIQEIDHTGPVFFALRDGAPLMTAAAELWNGKSIYPVGVYVNRPLMGIEDEISPEKARVNGNLIEYLDQLGMRQTTQVVWSDTGAWGTVIKAMKEHELVKQNFYPMFWYSHNPHIPGYLNGLIDELGLDEKIGEVINDSLECVFPQPYLRPLELIKTGRIWQVKLEDANRLASIWGRAALAGVRHAAIEHGSITPEESKQALKKIVEAHIRAKMSGECTGVLPQNTPTWSKGSAFIESWPDNLLP